MSTNKNTNIRKTLLPMDARGKVGIFSRGKATYPGGGGPNKRNRKTAQFNPQQAILDRMKNARRN